MANFYIFIKTSFCNEKILHFETHGYIDSILEIQPEGKTKRLILAPSCSGKTYLCKTRKDLIDGDTILYSVYQKYTKINKEFWLDPKLTKEVEKACCDEMDLWFKTNDGTVLANFIPYREMINCTVEVVVLSSFLYQRNALLRIQEGNKSQPVDIDLLEGNRESLTSYARKNAKTLFSSFDQVILPTNGVEVHDARDKPFIVDGFKYDFGIITKVEKNEQTQNEQFKEKPILMKLRPWIGRSDIFSKTWRGHIDNIKTLKWLKRFKTLYAMMYSDLTLILGPISKEVDLKGKHVKWAKNVPIDESAVRVQQFRLIKRKETKVLFEIVVDSNSFRKIIAAIG